VDIDIFSVGTLYTILSHIFI